MTCPCRAVNCLWSFIVGSLRMILFFATIALMLLSVLNMVALYQLFNMYYEESPTSISQFKVNAFTVVSLVVALVGSFGAFCAHRSSLQTFSTLTGIQGGLIIGLLLWANSAGYFHRENQRFLANMTRAQADYNWQGIPLEGPKRAATYAWDKMQYGSCCGIEGPRDWDRFRPVSLDDKVYPASCCAGFDFYTELDETEKAPCRDPHKLAPMGCREKLDQKVHVIIRYFVLFGIFQLVLAGVACCIKSHEEARRMRERQIIAQVTIVPAAEKSPSASLYPNLGYGTVAYTS